MKLAKHVSATLGIAMLCGSSTFASPDTKNEAQKMEAYKKAGTPGPEHELLKAMVGTWQANAKFVEKPGAPTVESSGTAENEMTLDGRFLKQDYSGTMDGQAFTGVSITGFDNTKRKFVTTWADSMSTSLIVAEGTGDQKSYTAYAECLNPVDKKKMKLRMVTRIESPTRHVFETWQKDDKGKEFKSMEIVYTKRS